MQTVDAHRRQADTVVLDDADQLGKRRRTVSRTADSRRQRRHQVVERITHALPALLDVQKRFDLHHGPHPAVARAFVATLEQPAIDFLTFVTTGGHRVLELCFRVLEQVAYQPQFQRMDAGDVALIGQVISARTVTLVQIGETFVGESQTRPGLVQVGADERVECALISARQQVTVYRSQADRHRVNAVEEGVEPLLRGLFLVAFPEAQQEYRAFAVGKLRQVFLAARVVIILEQLGAVVGRLIGAVAHHIAHQTNERQVDRLTQRLAQSRNPLVVFAPEIIETVHAATGEERFCGAGRIGAVECGRKHLRQVTVLVQQQIIHRPTGQPIRFLDRDFAQLRRAQARIAPMQLGDDLQIRRQHAHLRRRAQLQLAAFVDIERLIGAVGLDPDPRAIHAAFKQREAVAHLRCAGRGQQALAHQTGLCRKLRVGQVTQVLADAALQFAMQGAGGGQVKTVQVVKRAIEQIRQASARDTDALIGFDGLQGRLLRPVAVGDLGCQRGLGQRSVDDVGLGQQADVAVGQLCQFLASLGQIVRRATLGDYQ